MKRHPNLLAASVMAAAAAIVSAYTPCLGEVTVKRVAGPYGIYSKQRVWTQRVVTLSNTGTQPRRMDFGIVAAGLDGGTEHFTTITPVPAGAEKKALVAYRPGKLQPMTSGASLTGNMPVRCEQLYILKDAETGLETPLQASDTQGVPDTLTVVSFVGGGSRGDLAGYVGSMPGDPLGMVRSMTSGLADLPDVWYGYSMIDVLMLGGIDPAEMRASQTTAILDWARRGGTLVIAGGDRMPRLLAGGLGQAAGAAAVGSHDVRTVTVDGEGLDATVKLAATLPLVHLAPGEAETLFRANGLPLLVESEYGQGHVLTLALPVAGLEDPLLGAVWRKVREVARSLPPLSDRQFLPAGRETLKQIAGRRGATRRWPVGILVGMAGLVLVGGLASRFVRRGELVWLVLIPLAVVVSVSLWAYGRTLSDPERLRHIGLVSSLPGGKIAVREAFAYYSGPEQRQITLTSDGPRGVISDIGARAAGTTTETRSDDGTSLPDVAVQANDTAAFFIDTVLDGTPIASGLSFDAGGVVGTITNQLDARIDDAVVYSNGISYSLGSLEPGKATDVTIGPANQLGAGEFTGGGEVKPRRNELAAALVTTPSSGGKSATGGPRRQISGRATLIGYTPVSPLDPLPGRELERDGWCVLAWPVAFRAPASGTSVTIPAGFVEVDQRGTLIDPQTNEYQESSYGGSLGLKVRPPSCVSSLANATASVSVRLSAANFQLAVAGGKLDSGGQIVPDEVLQTVDDPSGTVAVEVPQAERFAGPDGSILLHLRVKRLDTGGQNMMSQTMKAKVDGIQIELKGTVR
jgi:hypothetical protein